MSHVAESTEVVQHESVPVLAKAVALVSKGKCELVEATDYLTWINQHGSLVGDYPLSSKHQLNFMVFAKTLCLQAGLDIHKEAERLGVKLPKNLLELGTNPLSLQDQRSLLKDEKFKQAYDRVCKEVVGKDAKYVIRYKDGRGPKGAYEIGLVPHHAKQNQYVMMCDFYSQGNGLLRDSGLGQHKRLADGQESWAANLKKEYFSQVAEITAKQNLLSGKYESYEQTTNKAGDIIIRAKVK